MKDIINKKIVIAENAIQELVKAADLKKQPDQMAFQIADFYEVKALNRLKTAKLICETSKKQQDYTDYSETVAAAYYAMYYIVHAYLAKVYKTKLRENLRGVHAITHNLVIYYLVKTKKLAQHLYNEYVQALEATSSVQNFTIESVQEKAYTYAEKYNKSREARETFTYKTTPAIEAYHAEHAIMTAEEFIYTIRQLMMK